MRVVDLDAAQINTALDALQDSIDHVRTVIKVASAVRPAFAKATSVPSELINSQNLSEFAKRYAKAWCSHNPESVAAFFAENASLTVNGGPPTPALEIARGFMREFPDMIVKFDKLEHESDRLSLDIDWNEHRTRRNRKQSSDQRLRALEDRQ